MGLENGLKSPILFVGADDSNNHDKRKSRIFCATFSFLQEDAESIYHEGKKTKKDFDLWFKGERSREFCFGLLTDPEFSKMQPSLPLALPQLLLDYVPHVLPVPERIWVAIDGPLPRGQEFFLRNYLEKYFPKGVIIRNFVKRNSERARKPLSKRYESPTILEMAHTRANEIYNNLTDYIESPRRVELKTQRIKDTYLKIKYQEL